MTTADTTTVHRSRETPSGYEQSGDVRTFVTFDLAGQAFAADVADIREILDLQHICQLPNAPSELLGMIDVRGEGIAVLDLAVVLGLPRRDEGIESRIIVLDIAHVDGSAIAMLADRVRKVVEVRGSDVDAIPTVPGGWTAGAISGVLRLDGRLVYVVELGPALARGAADLPGPFDFE
jgi:purine-binding chemotaxis protein CheW